MNICYDWSRKKEAAQMRVAARNIWLTSANGAVNPIAPSHAHKYLDGPRNLEKLERARARLLEGRGRSKHM